MSLPSHIASYWLRRRIQHLVLHVTDRCNLRCKHCFVDLTERNTLTIQDCRRLSNDLGDILWLDVGGGEPYLLDELPELISPFECEVLGLPTNGHFPEKIVDTTREILRTCKAKDVVVSVSLEGFKEQHQEIRRNPQSYDRAFETMRRLRELAKTFPRLRVKCNTVITNKNADHLVEFMRYMRESGLVDFHSVIMMRGLPYDSGIELPYLDTLKALRPQIFEILESYLWGCGILKRNFLRRYYRFLWDVSLGNLEKNTQVIPCTGGRTHMVVWANGDVSSCELLPAVGNIHEKGWDEIMTAKSRTDQLKLIREKKCSCTHNCVMLDSILFNPMNYTKMLVC